MSSSLENSLTVLEMCTIHVIPPVHYRVDLNLLNVLLPGSGYSYMAGSILEVRAETLASGGSSSDDRVIILSHKHVARQLTRALPCGSQPSQRVTTWERV